MSKDKVIKVGLIGYGIVGTGVVRLFNNQKSSDISLEAVVVANADKARKLPVKNLTTDVSQVVKNPDIDLVVEVMGGYQPALDYILRAIKNGKHVVTANKAVISEYGPEIFKEASRHNVNVSFEGAVGGGIQIVNPLMEQYSIGTIKSITGILNGTSNFILTRMSEGMGYECALKIAQQKGFAEADPSFDVKGIDAAQKIAILASIAFGKWIKPSEVYCEGITEITPIDIEEARGLDHVVKLLAIAKKTEKGEMDIRVHPALVHSSHQLATVNDEFNVIYISGEPFGNQLLIGKGAGEGPTAFSVYNDIVKTADMIRKGIVRNLEFNNQGIRIADQHDIETMGYLRIYLSHVPLTLRDVLTVLGEHGWNIRHSIQRDREEYRKVSGGIPYIPDIITHEPLKFGVVRKILPELEKARTKDSHPIVLEKPFYMRFYGND